MAKKKGGAKRSQTLQVDTLLSPDLAGPVSPSVRRRGASTENLDTSAVDNEDGLSPQANGQRVLRRTASSSSFNASPFAETFEEEDGFGKTLVGAPENVDQENGHHDHGHHHDDEHDNHKHSHHEKDHTHSHTHSHSHSHSQSSLHKRNQSKDIHNHQHHQSGHDHDHDHGHEHHHHHSDNDDDEEDTVADLKLAKKNRERRGHHRIHSLSHNLFPGSMSQKSTQHGPTEMHAAAVPSLLEIIQNSPSTLRTRLIWGCIHFLIGGALWVKGQFGDSLCVTGFGYMVVFDAFGVLTHYVANVLLSYRELRQSSLKQPYGLRRYEVIVSFANTIYLLFAAMYMTKESLEHLMLEGADDHEDEDIEMKVPLFLVVCGIICTLVSAVGLRNHHQITKLLSKRSIYGGSKVHRSNKASTPLDLLLNSALALTSLSFGAAVIFIGSLRTHPALGTFDKAVAFIESFVMFYIGIPAATALAKILLQTTPDPLQSQIEGVLREIQHNTSILTVHSMHLWQNTFGQPVATLQVHIRPEADEDIVLEEVRRKFDGIIGGDRGDRGELSVRVVKGL